MELTELEADFLGDLAVDTHGVWEVFYFVKQYHPDASTEEVWRVGRDLIDRWNSLGWIMISTEPIRPSAIRSVDDLLTELDRLGPPSSDPLWLDAPSLDLTEQARRDAEWLP